MGVPFSLRTVLFREASVLLLDFSVLLLDFRTSFHAVISKGFLPLSKGFLPLPKGFLPLREKIISRIDLIMYVYQCNMLSVLYIYIIRPKILHDNNICFVYDSVIGHNCGHRSLYVASSIVSTIVCFWKSSCDITISTNQQEQTILIYHGDIDG